LPRLRGPPLARFARFEPRQDGVHDIHADDRAGARQASGIDCAADEVAQARRQRQEEADQDRAEAGQEEEDGFRRDAWDATRDLGGLQASIPKDGEGGDCGGDRNGEAPGFGELKPLFRTFAWRRAL
jgi:alkylation response protein AidB-like acyl-CoA dehydrogenase